MVEQQLLVKRYWRKTRIGEAYKFTSKPRGLNLPLEIEFIPMEAISEKNEKIDQALVKKLKKIASGTYIENGDLIIAKITPSFENGKQGIVELNGAFGYATTEVLPLQEINGISSKWFLAYWLRQANIRSSLAAKMEGSTGRQRLSKQVLENTEIFLPSFEEQKAIVRILSTIQDSIAAQEELIAKLKELKQSMMHHLFTKGTKGEKTKMTEIGEIPESWEIIELGKVYEFTKKPKGLLLNQNIPFVPMENIPIGAIHVAKYVEKTIGQISSGTYVENGDLLLAKITPSFENGKQAILKIEKDFAYATTEVIPIKERAGNSSIMYLFYFLLKNEIRKKLAGKMEGTTGRQRLSKSVLEKVLLPFASYDEQIKIANVLAIIDQKIEITQRKTAIYQSLFKILLHTLMSGEKESINKYG